MYGVVAVLLTQANVLEGYLLGGAAALVSLYGLWFFEFKKKHTLQPVAPHPPHHER
jgi:hypothetical protein